MASTARVNTFGYLNLPARPSMIDQEFVQQQSIAQPAQRAFEMKV
ncbi:hypothetical protein [Dyadobacter flavalbus]|nr:hypothetical protein [Dyadobacter flavalbus]